MNLTKKISTLKNTYLQNSLYICTIIVDVFSSKTSNYFQSDCNFTNNNTPSLPLCDAHLEGFFFL